MGVSKWSGDRALRHAATAARFLDIFKGFFMATSCACFFRPLAFSAVALLALTAVAAAQVTVTIDSATMTSGYMNVSDLPSNGGAFQFGSSWGVGDLNATFPTPSSVNFTPNTIGDPNPYWYTPSGGPGSTGNKIMEANLYNESTGVLNGQTVTFEGNVSSFTLQTGTNPDTDYTFKAFIRDFAPDYSSVVETLVPITSTGLFSATMATINNPARHVQYGLQMKGADVWFTDVASKGSVTVNAVPEPSTYALLAFGGCAAAALRRRMIRRANA